MTVEVRRSMRDNRLLVVDERPEFCKYVRRVAPYEVQTASNMRAFTAAYQTSAPDALFIDLITIGSGVIELSLWLAEKSFTKLLLITGVMDVSKEQYVLDWIEDHGPVAVMVKPVHLDELRDALASERNS